MVDGYDEIFNPKVVFHRRELWLNKIIIWLDVNGVRNYYYKRHVYCNK